MALPAKAAVAEAGGSGDFDKFLGALEKDRDYFYRYELSPLHTLILAGANLTAIKRVHALGFSSIDADAVIFACKYGASKDILLWMADELSEPMCLYKCVQAYMHQNDPAVVSALNKKTKDKLFKIGRFYEGIPRRTGLEFSLAFSLIAPKLKRLCVNENSKWTQAGLLEIVRVIFLCPNLHSLVFSLPSTDMISEQSQNMSAEWHSLVANWASHKKVCGVKSLTLQIALPTNDNTIALLGGLVHLPNLEFLHIGFGVDRKRVHSHSIDDLALPLKKIVQDGKLHTLTLTNNTGTKDGSQAVICRAWFPLLDHINPHLRYLKFWNLVQDQTTGLQPMANRVEQNVEGARLHFLWLNRDKFGDAPGFRRDCILTTKLDYYLALNSAGRWQVREFRENQLTMAQFVVLLAAVGISASRDNSNVRRANASILQYGLLREVPSLWSDIALPPEASKRRTKYKHNEVGKSKRSRAQDEEGRPVKNRKARARGLQ